MRTKELCRCEREFCYIGQAGFELGIILPQLSKYWNCRYVPPSLVRSFVPFLIALSVVSM